MLEYVVRPFQTPNSHGRVIIHSTPKESTETAVLTWGGEADLPDAQYYETGFNTKKNREDFTEQQRESDTVRIMGQDPDDDSPSYIDVDRGRKLWFDTTTGRTVQSTDPGKSDYVGGTGGFDDQTMKNLGFEPANAARDPVKGKATMALKNTGS